MSNQSLREAAQQAIESLKAAPLSWRAPAVIEALEDALAQPDDKAQTVAREGWKLVPVVPTEEMHAAAVRTIARCAGNDDFPPRVYQAMLYAAPQPPAEQGAELSDYPPLPEPDIGTIQLHAKGKPISMGYSEESMRVYVDADRAGRGGVSS